MIANIETQVPSLGVEQSGTAPAMHQAVQRMPEDEGPDAVTLSSRQADGGLGIVAALDGATVANLDEAAGLGGGLSTVTKQHLPLMFVAKGQRVPEDLYLARARNHVDQAAELASSRVLPGDSVMVEQSGGFRTNVHV